MMRVTPSLQLFVVIQVTPNPTAQATRIHSLSFIRGLLPHYDCRDGPIFARRTSDVSGDRRSTSWTDPQTIRSVRQRVACRLQIARAT